MSAQRFPGAGVVIAVGRQQQEGSGQWHWRQRGQLVDQFEMSRGMMCEKSRESEFCGMEVWMFCEYGVPT